MKVLITGGTGFLGKYLTREIAQTFEHVYLLTRNPQNNPFSDLTNITLIEGDITVPDLFSKSSDRKKLTLEITHVIHAAAFYDLSATHEECYLQNVLGTQNVMHFTKSLTQLVAFYYISTIAVADDQKYFYEENSLLKRAQFNDHYSKTKYFAEKLVRENIHKLKGKTIIIRPGIIVGDSKTGAMEKIDGPYYFIEAFRKNLNYLKSLKMAPLSYSPRTKIPIIPVDHCAHYIRLIIERTEKLDQLTTLHLISEETPSVQEFLDDLQSVFGLKIKFIPVPKNLIHNTILKIFGIPKEVIPFMFSKVSYDKTTTNKVVPEILHSKYSEYKGVLLKK